MAQTWRSAFCQHVKDELGMPDRATQKFQVHNNEVYEQRLVHKFRMGDVEDPEIYCAQPIYEWQQTDKGQWVMKHGLNPTFHLHTDPMSYSTVVVITAGITPKRWTEYVLRGWEVVDK